MSVANALGGTPGEEMSEANFLVEVAQVEITEVRIRLRNGGDRKLKAYATITFDREFVVRDVKIIEGRKGLFVAMPSRRLRQNCPECRFGNEIRNKFCGQCGRQLEVPTQPVENVDGARSEHRDLAHPITSQAREYIQRKVLDAYEAEKSRAPSVGY